MTTQSPTPFLSLDNTHTPPILRVSGDWVLAHYARLEQEIGGLGSRLPASVSINLSQLGTLDTAGAALLAELLGEERLQHLHSLAPELSHERRVLLETIGQALQGFLSPPQPHAQTTMLALFQRIGCAIERFWQHGKALLGFIGVTLESLLTTLFRPSRWRITPLMANIEQIGLDAVPIVMLLTFLVGAVVAFLGATVLASFGASIFTVNLVAFSFLREFAVLLVAILMAGRTASAFTAQIGLMKANEEIDAIQVLGLNPIELLVLPRVLALLLCLPMLTFIGMICGLVGGMTVCALALDIPPVMFMSIVQNNVDIQHFYVGLSKAPLFAFLIAVIGCLEGFNVSGSAASVGSHTTASVVHSIFMVILLDAVAALFFMEIGW